MDMKQFMPADHQEAQRRSRQRLISLLALVVCCAALIASGTLAFYNAEKTAKNVMTTGKLEIDLKEETDNNEPWPEEGFDGIMPGRDVTKIVYGVNTGSMDVWLRIRLDKVITPAEGVTAELNFENITLDINTSDWTEKDGWYYLNEPLKPEKESVPLFTNVHFGKNLGNEYMNAKVIIDVTMQAVQAGNNGDSALTATGWPEA